MATTAAQLLAGAAELKKLGMNAEDILDVLVKLHGDEPPDDTPTTAAAMDEAIKLTTRRLDILRANRSAPALMSTAERAAFNERFPNHDRLRN